MVRKALRRRRGRVWYRATFTAYACKFRGSLHEVYSSDAWIVAYDAGEVALHVLGLLGGVVSCEDCACGPTVSPGEPTEIVVGVAGREAQWYLGRIIIARVEREPWLYRGPHKSNVLAGPILRD